MPAAALVLTEKTRYPGFQAISHFRNFLERMFTHTQQRQYKEAAEARFAARNLLVVANGGGAPMRNAGH